MDVRFVEDRRFPLVDGLEAVLLDHWAFSPEMKALAHGLMVLVCPVGLDRLPLPVSNDARPLDDDRRAGETYFVLPRDEGGMEKIKLQWFVADTLVYVRPRLKRQRRFARPTTVRLSGHIKEDELLAQLILTALRSGADDSEAFEWLVNWARDITPSPARDYARAAVDHAILNFISPVGTLRRYLRRVARGIAREGQVSADVLEQASQTGTSPRSIYRWRKQGADAPLMGERLRQKRLKSELARQVATKKQIKVDAARMQIERRLNRGLSLAQIATELLAPLPAE
jgi:hypothetical protein